MAMDLVSVHLTSNFPGQNNVVRFNFDVPIPNAPTSPPGSSATPPSVAEIEGYFDNGDWDAAKAALKKLVPVTTSGAIDYFFSVLPKPAPPPPTPKPKP